MFMTGVLCTVCGAQVYFTKCNPSKLYISMFVRHARDMEKNSVAFGVMILSFFMLLILAFNCPFGFMSIKVYFQVHCDEWVRFRHGFFFCSSTETVVMAVKRQTCGLLTVRSIWETTRDLWR